MSIGSILNTAREAMNAQQIAVHVNSQNVANATTAGYSKQRVELLSPSRVSGTIRTPCLVVAEGAVFNGNCEMISPDGGKVVRLQPKEEGLQAAERA